MSSPFFSVILPTYNRSSTVIRAVDSVLKQSFEDWELLIVDDGSTDETAEILANLSNPKIKILRTENRGVSAARNLAAKESMGSWLAFLDSDDEWLPKKLELQNQLIRENLSMKLVHGEEIWIRNGVRVNPMKKHKKGGGDQFKASVRLCAISPSTAAMAKETFFSLGGFREDFPVCEDYDLWLKFTSLFPVGFIEDPLIKKYGGHEDQLSRRYKAMDYWRVKSLWWILQHRRLSEERKREATTTLAKKLEILKKGYLKHGNMENFQEINQLEESLMALGKE